MWTGLVWLRIGTGGELMNLRIPKNAGELSTVQTTRDLSSGAQLHGVSYGSRFTVCKQQVSHKRLYIRTYWTNKNSTVLLSNIMMTLEPFYLSFPPITAWVTSESLIQNSQRPCQSCSELTVRRKHEVSVNWMEVRQRQSCWSAVRWSLQQGSLVSPSSVRSTSNGLFHVSTNNLTRVSLVVKALGYKPEGRRLLSL
jgi:hypothetical protein